MEEFIARENIRRFEAQLRSATDEQQKETIRSLLEAERLKLDALCGANPPGNDQE